MKSFIFIISLLLSLTACQSYTTSPCPFKCDPNFAHCPGNNEDVVARVINTSIGGNAI